MLIIAFALVKIRLRREGAKGRPFYRLVVADARAPRDGAFIEVLGNYSPLTEPPSLSLKEERVLHWLRQGAQPTKVAAQLLARSGLLEKAEGKR